MNHLTIITLHYNRSELIKSNIKSIAYALKLISNKIKIEHLIIDDGSNNNEKELLKSYITNIKHIKLIEIPHCGNLSKLKNLGIKLSESKYITFLDSDDYLNPLALIDIINIINSKNYDVIGLPRFSLKNREILDKYNPNLYLNNIKNYICVAHYIIKKDFLIKNNIFFEEKIFNYYADDLYVFLNIWNYLQYDNYFMLDCDWYYVSTKNNLDRTVKIYEKNTSKIKQIQYLFHLKKFISSKFNDEKILNYGLDFINHLLHEINK